MDDESDTCVHCDSPIVFRGGVWVHDGPRNRGRSCRPTYAIPKGQVLR